MATTFTIILNKLASSQEVRMSDGHIMNKNNCTNQDYERKDILMDILMIASFELYLFQFNGNAILIRPKMKDYVNSNT